MIIAKTLGITFTPAVDLNGGQVTVDIGKYYDNSVTRVIKAWVYGTYRDITAGAVAEACDSFCFLNDLTVMELPAGNLTPSTGTATIGGAPFVSGNNSGSIIFDGDAILESPVFEFSVTGMKKQPGAYPVSFQFVFYLNVQLEFNFRDLSDLEQSLKAFQVGIKKFKIDHG